MNKKTAQAGSAQQEKLVPDALKQILFGIWSGETPAHAGPNKEYTWQECLIIDREEESVFTNSLKRGLIIALTSAVLVCSTVSSANEESFEWHYELTLYAWAKSVDGTSGDLDLDLNFLDDILDMLDGAFMTSFEAEYGVVSLFGQFEWSKISDGAKISRDFDYTIPPIGPTVPVTAGAKVEVEEDQYAAEIGAGYTLSESASTRWQILGGAKWFNNDLTGKFKNVTVTGPGGNQFPLDGAKVNSDEDWWHPFLGLRVATRLTDSWRLRLRGDYGYRESDNSSWMLEALVDWRFNDWGAMEFGYRHLDIDYDNGSNSSPYSYDVEESGPRIGLIVHF